MAACTTVESAKRHAESRRSGTDHVTKAKLTKFATVGLAVSSAALALAACGSSNPASEDVDDLADRSTHMVKMPGGTLTIAEAPAAGPNYIFPMMGGAYFSVRTSS